MQAIHARRHHRNAFVRYASAKHIRLAIATLAAAALSGPRASPHSSIQRVCTSSASSAHISVLGTTQFLANGCEGNLVLSASDVPEGAMGILVYGRGMMPSMSWRSGSMCVGGVLRRSPLLRAGPREHSLWVSLEGSRLRQRAETLGIDWTFQFWYRAGKVVDVSDALTLRLGPPALPSDQPSVPICRDGDLFFPPR